MNAKTMYLDGVPVGLIEKVKKGKWRASTLEGEELGIFRTRGACITEFSKRQREAVQQTLPNMPDPDAPVKVNWVKLQRPKNWRPKVGDELIGYYLGQTYRNGKWGQYKVATIQVPDEAAGRAFMVSGTTIIQALDTSGVQQGQLVRVVFNGYKELEPTEDSGGKVRKMKLFDVFATSDQLSREQVLTMTQALQFN